MGGSGPQPKARRSRDRDTTVRDTVKSDGKMGGYDLPDDVLGVDKQGVKIEWHAQTQRWWTNWRLSPQGTRMVTAVDWDFLLDTALMHHTMWAAGRWEFSAEVRLRAAKFGATPEDRARLKFEIATPEMFPAGDAGNGTNVTAISDRRGRLSKG